MKITIIILQLLSIIAFSIVIYDNQKLKEQNQELIKVSKEAVDLNGKLINICDSMIENDKSLIKFINQGKESDEE